MKLRLKKDLPGIPAGTEFVHKSGWKHVTVYDEHSCETSYKQTSVLFAAYFSHCNDPDWFEILEEKEFTRSDMIDFCYWRDPDGGDSVREYIKKDVVEWLESRQK